MAAQTDREAAAALTEYLTKRDTSYSGRPGYSPIELRVQTEITAMMSRLAAELVAENAELPAMIRDRVRTVIAQAMRDDQWLTQNVVQAVAKVLTASALGTE